MSSSEPLSCYILTLNSEKYLEKVLAPLTSLVDDLVIVDSGSKDKTEEIAAQFKCRFIFRKFDNFKDQRNYALNQCQHRWVLSLDSDEVMDQEMVSALLELKQNNFKTAGLSADAYGLKRRWFLFGKEVRVFLPISSPDYPTRLFDKEKVGFNNSLFVHERPDGFQNKVFIRTGSIHHYSCDSIFELFNKLNLYTSLAAQDLENKGKETSWANIFLRGFSTWSKWYLTKGGWRDGEVGFLLGIYAGAYGFLKYLKLRFRRNR